MSSVERKESVERKGSKLKRLWLKPSDRRDHRRHKQRNGRGVRLGGERQQEARRAEGGPWGSQPLHGRDGDGMECKS